MNKKILALAVSLSVSLFLSPILIPLVCAVEDYWTTMEPMPTARFSFGVAVVDGKIYAIGGSNGSNSLGFVEEYDPASDTWNTKQSMPTARYDFAIAVYQNKIYVMGGIIGESSPIYSGYTGVTEVYDPSADTWETKEPIPTARARLHANVVGDKIYLIGGIKYSSIWPFSQGTGGVNEVYDPLNDSWSTKAPIPTISCYPSAVVTDKIYFMGGMFLPDITTQIYNPETDTWSSGKAIPTGVFLAAAGATTGVFAPQRIYVFSGQVEANIVTNLTQVYNPENDEWTVGTPMPTPRFGLGAAVVNDEIFVIGGKTGDTYLAVNEKYTPIGYIPEFPSWIALPLFLIATSFAVITKRKAFRRVHKN